MTPEILEMLWEQSLKQAGANPSDVKDQKLTISTRNRRVVQAIPDSKAYKVSPYFGDDITVEVVLPSGRKFRYRFTRRLSIAATPDQISLYVDEAMQEKYRCCAWDQKHQLENSKQNIREYLISYITEYCEEARQRRGE